MTPDIATSGTLCIILAVVVIALFIAQIALYIRLYGGIAGYRLMNRTPVREEEPAISVVVPIFVEDSDYLDFKLPSLLTQDYAQFEVVLVYVGNSDDFFNEIKSLQNLYPNLSPTQISYSPKYPISIKTALNIGIKAAKYDFVLTTSYDAVPTSERWLSLLAKGFIYGDIVLGYSGFERKKGFANFIFREYRLNKSLAWISSAIRGRTYSCSRNALGFKKSLYFDARGFNFLHMNIGEDDLFVQKIATPDNVSIVLSPRATSEERVWGGFKWWIQRTRLLRTTYRHYPKGAMLGSTIELILRALFFVALLVAIILLPWQFKLGALAVALIRFLLVLFIFTRNSRRLGERGLISGHILYDFIEPALRLFVAAIPNNQSNKTWE